MQWFSRRLESLIDNIIFAALVTVGAVIWSFVKSLPGPVVFVIGLATFLLMLSILRVLLSLVDRTKRGIINTGTNAGNTGTVVITQRDNTKANYEQIKKAVIADILSGKIKVKGIMRGGTHNVSNEDKAFILMLAEQMEFSNHGHDDLSGLMADRASGVDLNELMTRNCLVCGQPRNKGRETK